MKKLFTILVAGLMISAQVFAVTAKDVCGRFEGTLWIDWDEYPNKQIFLLPGTVENTVTFVLPDFSWGNGKLGNIVLPNISMDANGTLTVEETTLWLDSIGLRASIKMLQNYEDEGDFYNSVVSASEAQVTLEIAEKTTLPAPIIVLFEGNAVRTKNYALNNGGFEGAWTNNEPEGWHSFGSGTGELVDFVKDNTFQFTQADVVRPGSTGTNSALLSSSMVAGVKANGNCTNGQVNAGSMDASNAEGNYNFSDPTNEGFNNPFHGRPDSLVFWAKYQPADLDINNEVNKARVNVVITTNARYQDPETTDAHAAAKIAAATLNYSAVEGFGWQRLSIPFEYVAANAEAEPAFILATFSTNSEPGGGSSYSTSGKNKKTVLDSVYIDDVEAIYNHKLKAFTMDGEAVAFKNGVATVNSNYCDDCVKYGATGNGLTSQTFIGFDAANKCIHVYVIADDFAQSIEYNSYIVQFADTETPIASVVESASAGKRFEKILQDGQLFIRRDNVWYNAAGLRVK